MGSLMTMTRLATHILQGKSLSLICASLTWLRNFKSNKLEVSMQNAGDAYKDEPAWLVDQLLRRKREELVQRWEDREKRLEAIRLKEKALEDRGRKRRRLEEAITPGDGNDMDADEAEWLLDDWGDRDTGVQDALSGLSKESREVLERIGLGGPRKKEEDNDILEEEIKVRGVLFHTATLKVPLVTVCRSIIHLEPTRNCRNSLRNCAAQSFLRHCRLLSQRKSRLSKRRSNYFRCLLDKGCVSTHPSRDSDQCRPSMIAVLSSSSRSLPRNAHMFPKRSF